MRISLKWKAILLGWGLYGAYMALQGVLLSARLGEPVPIARIVTTESIYSILWIIFTPVVLLFVRRVPFSKDRWFRPLTIHLGLSLLIGLLHKGIHGFLTTLYRVVAEGLAFSWNAPYNFMLSSFDYGIQLYWIIVLLFYSHEYYRRLQQNEMRSVELEKLLVQSQLQALKAQLQPHFLFNSLNAIHVLVGRDPQRARSTIRKLSDLLRLTLDSSERQEITLREEMTHVECYLDIERVRFGDRLTVTLDAQPETLDASVPTMILQPLVENAIKHGLSRVSGPAVLEISAVRENGLLRLSVHDNGPGLTGKRDEILPGGVGLSNTRARLERLYGTSHSLDLLDASSGSGGVTASITIPFRAAENPAPARKPHTRLPQ